MHAIGSKVLLRQTYRGHIESKMLHELFDAVAQSAAKECALLCNSSPMLLAHAYHAHFDRCPHGLMQSGNWCSTSSQFCICFPSNRSNTIECPTTTTDDSGRACVGKDQTQKSFQKCTAVARVDRLCSGCAGCCNNKFNHQKVGNRAGSSKFE